MVMEQLLAICRNPGRVWSESPRKARVVGIKSIKMEEKKSDPWGKDMAAIQADRDREAFARLFEYFAPRIKGFLVKSGARPRQAEDCAQEVMITLWQKSTMFDPARATVATWIFTIARNKMIDAMRRENRPEPEALPWGPEPEQDPADHAEMAEEHEKLRNAIKDLPEKQKTLLEASFFHDKSHSEIAEDTGLPLGTIKSRLRLAIAKLRERIEVTG